MQYQTKTFRSAPNLTQEDALEALQSAPFFSKGSKVTGIRPGSNKQWVATVKLAGPFPPSGGDEGGDDDAPSGDSGKPAFPDDGGDSESSDSDSESSGPPSPSGEGGDSEGGEKPKEPKGDDAIIQLLTEILHALQGGAGPEGGMGGPDALAQGPSGMSAPPKGHGPPGAGPPGAGKPPVGGRPLHPGEAPPGSTPVGAPAFASLNAQVKHAAGKLPTIALHADFDPSRKVNEYVNEARAAVEPYGYKLRLARVEGNKVRIVASVR